MNVFKKDVKRLLVLLILFAFIIGLESLISLGGINLLIENIYFQMYVPLFIKLIQFLEVILVIVLIPLIIQGDPLVGTTAFWFTRPISRKSLLITKLTFIFLFLVFLPLMAEMIVLYSNHITWNYILLAIPEIVIEKLSFLIPLLILASLTPKFSRFALVGAIIFAAYILFIIFCWIFVMFCPWAWSKLPIFDRTKYLNPSLSQSILVVKNILIIVWGTCLIIHHFLSRYTARTVRWLVVGILLMLVLTKVWSLDFLKVDLPATAKEMFPKDSVDVKIDLSHVLIEDGFRYKKTDPRTKKINSKLIITTDLPPGYFPLINRPSFIRMVYSEGTMLESHYTSANRYESLANEVFMIPLQAVLNDIKLVNPYKEEVTHAEIFSLKEEDFDRFKEREGTYFTETPIDIYQFEVASVLVLHPGEKIQSGPRQIVIHDIQEHSTGCTVTLIEREIDLLFDKTKKKTSIYAKMNEMAFEKTHFLQNSKRKEAFLSERGDQYMDYLDFYNEGLRLKVKVTRLDFSHVTDRGGPLPKIDKEWLKDAELVRIEAKKKGMITKQIKLEDFALPGESTVSQSESAEERRLKKYQQQNEEWEKRFQGKDDSK